jgi:hypothetical protein
MHRRPWMEEFSRRVAPHLQDLSPTDLELAPSSRVAMALERLRKFERRKHIRLVNRSPRRATEDE